MKKGDGGWESGGEGGDVMMHSFSPCRKYDIFLNLLVCRLMYLRTEYRHIN